MSDPRLCCPHCDATVWHMCHPPTYRRRPLHRWRPLARLTIREERERWARGKLGPMAEAFETIFDPDTGEERLLRPADDD
jgi:hypothetical protein